MQSPLLGKPWLEGRKISALTGLLPSSTLTMVAPLGFESMPTTQPTEMNAMAVPLLVAVDVGGVLGAAQVL